VPSGIVEGVVEEYGRPQLWQRVPRFPQHLRVVVAEELAHGEQHATPAASEDVGRLGTA
jgi:hypothetical protein